MSRPRPYTKLVDNRQRVPKRDWLDKLTLVTALAGVLVVVVSIVLSQLNQASSNRDMSIALNEMAEIANASAGQLQALNDQADATTNAANATLKSAEATRVQATSANRQANAAIAAGQATDRLAQSGSDQVKALLDSDRPWAATTLPQSSDPIEGQEWVITIPVVNTGRAPALKAQAWMLTTIVEKGKSYRLAPIPPCNKSCALITILPGNSTVFTEVASRESMTKEYVERLNGTDIAIIIQTRIHYFDNVGKEHDSFGCYYFVKRIHFTNCAAQNDAN